MSAPRLVGFAGYAGAGKDESARVLVQRGWVRVAFADPLKEACRAIFGFSDEQLWGSEKDVADLFWGFSPRWAMQRLGTEAVREVFNEGVWCQALVARASRLWAQHPGASLCVPDVRFGNEVAAIRAIGGQVVLVRRPGVSGDGHASESMPGWPEGHFDAAVDNDGTVAELHARVLATVAEMGVDRG